MQAAIQVENLSKVYRINAVPKGATDFRETLADLAKEPLRRMRAWSLEDAAPENLFWALNDVSFEIPVGEVVGLIGNNGAGKSTLLKILSRITQPTSGRAVINGRLGTILEVSTGFHPELTGRENIFLAGAHRGMRRKEIVKRFDEIVDFADIGRFIDMPVKRYSSGMYVRLAFAVASALDPDVLLLDEVLAVGDAGFKAKCVAKMEQLAKDGRTVVLCSHSHSRIAKLSDRVLLLHKGKVAYYGEPDDAFQLYAKIQEAEKREQTVSAESVNSQEPSVLSIASQASCSVSVLSESGLPVDEFESGDKIAFHVELDIGDRALSHPLVSLTIRKGGNTVCHLITRQMVDRAFSLAGQSRIRCLWEPGRLSAGTYSVDVGVKDGLHKGARIVRANDAATFSIGLGNVDRYERSLMEQMVVLPRGNWDFSQVTRAAG